MQSLLQDLGYAARMLHRQLGFTVIAPMTIAMQTATTMPFSVVAWVQLTDRPVGVKKVANPTEVGAATSERNCHASFTPAQARSTACDREIGGQEHVISRGSAHCIH